MDPLVGAIIGGLLTLAGVSITLIFEYFSKRAEQRYSQRKEVYFAAADAIAEYIPYLLSYANLEMNMQERAKLLASSSGWLNKIHISGSLATIKAFNDSQEYFALELVSLMKKRMALDKVLKEGNFISREIDNLREFREQVSRTLGDISRQPPSQENAALVTSLAVQLDPIQTQLLDLNMRLQQLATQRDGMHRSLFLDVINSSIKFDEFLVRVNIEARKELGVPFETEQYTSLMAESHGNIRKAMQSALPDQQ